MEAETGHGVPRTHIRKPTGSEVDSGVVCHREPGALSRWTTFTSSPDSSGLSPEFRETLLKVPGPRVSTDLPARVPGVGTSEEGDTTPVSVYPTSRSFACARVYIYERMCTRVYVWVHIYVYVRYVHTCVCVSKCMNVCIRRVRDSVRRPVAVQTYVWEASVSAVVVYFGGSGPRGECLRSTTYVVREG